MSSTPPQPQSIDRAGYPHGKLTRSVERLCSNPMWVLWIELSWFWKDFSRWNKVKMTVTSSDSTGGDEIEEKGVGGLAFFRLVVHSFIHPFIPFWVQAEEESV